MTFNIRQATGVLAVSALALTAGCSASAGSGASDLETLRFATLMNGPTSLNQQVGIESGIFEKHGINVELVNADSGPELGGLVTSGAADIGDVAGPTPVTMVEGKTPTKMLSDGESSNYEVIGRADVKGEYADKEYPEKIKELKGHRIGIPARGSAIESVVSSLLEEAGLDPDKDVTWVSTGSVQTTVAAMKNKQIDYTSWPAAITRTTFEDKLDIYTVAASDKGEGGEVGEKMLTGSSIVLEKTANEKQDEMVAFCKAMDETVDWMNDKANEDELGTIAQEWMDLDNHEQGVIAGNATAATAIGSLTKEQWDNNTSLFPDIGSPEFDDVIFKPCF